MSSSTPVINLHHVAAHKRPADLVYIGRPGRYGNPFVIEHFGDTKFGRKAVLKAYRKYFLRRVKEDEEFRRDILSLKGKTLGCFCHPEKCHGDIIAEWIEKHG